MVTGNLEMARITAVKDAIVRWLDGRDVSVALTLGSGLGGFGEEFQQLKVSYQELGLPTCQAKGHAGLLRFCKVGNCGILVFDGRVHHYEGHDFPDIVLAVRAAALAGAHTHIITCASGGVRETLRPEQLVLISDHINLMGGSPLDGPNTENLGPRFPDMTQAYDSTLRAIAKTAAASINMQLEEGVYAAMRGPCYETPAEVRMLRTLGVDMVGMSTVPEVIALRHMKTRVLGISCVANLAAGVIPNQLLSHEDVVAAGHAAAPSFRSLIMAIIERL